MPMESIIENRKFYKRNKVLNLIRTRDECSIYDIKKLTFYSMATVQVLIEELIQCGMIVSEKGSPKGKGRRPFLLHINPDYGCFVGTEFHSSQINCCVVDFEGRILHSSFSDILPEDTRETVIGKLFCLIENAVHEASRPLLGIGVGIPGYFDAERGMGIEYPPIEDWLNVPIRTLIEEHFHVPCCIENNVASMAMGYHSLYLPKQSQQSMLFVSIRTGIRLVSIVQNRLFLCCSGYDGQLGHVRISGGSRMCLCGKRGCLNTEVSDTGLRSKLLEDIAAKRQKALWDACEHKPDLVSTEKFVDTVLSGDTEAKCLLEETAGYLGQALGMVTDIIAPEHLVIYGELARCGEALRVPLEAAIAKNAMHDNANRLKLSLCPPNECLGAFGAVLILMRKQYAYIEETV